MHKGRVSALLRAPYRHNYGLPIFPMLTHESRVVGHARLRKATSLDEHTVRNFLPKMPHMLLEVPKLASDLLTSKGGECMNKEDVKNMVLSARLLSDILNDMGVAHT